MLPNAHANIKDFSAKFRMHDGTCKWIAAFVPILVEYSRPTTQIDVQLFYYAENKDIL